MALVIANIALKVKRTHNHSPAVTLWQVDRYKITNSWWTSWSKYIINTFINQYIWPCTELWSSLNGNNRIIEIYHTKNGIHLCTDRYAWISHSSQAPSYSLLSFWANDMDSRAVVPPSPSRLQCTTVAYGSTAAWMWFIHSQLNHFGKIACNKPFTDTGGSEMWFTATWSPRLSELTKRKNKCFESDQSNLETGSGSAD